MLIDIAYVTGGLVALVICGDVLVRGAVAVAQRAGLSPFVIGLTLVGFGTSMPELMTSLIAAFQGLPGIALGNVVGSNIANILLILGVTAAMGAVPGRALLERDGMVMLGATALCAGLVMFGYIGRAAGLLCLAALAGYLIVTLRSKRPEDEAEEQVEGMSVWAGGGVFLLGLLGVMAGAKFLVQGASEIARAFAVSEAVIGLTIVAVGTSLPELVTSVVAACKGQGAIAIGNIIGSNIFNVLGILGITAAVYPLTVPADMTGVTLAVFILAAVAPAAFARTRGQIPRWAGFSFVAAYVGYVVAIVA
ncbi:calcium/sodium antiporter [Yoonia maritima]|uniref:calcium/sodium antiporter n=1 Tax=Yoonia maritima TaxID=1435347 RepID=UPI000D0E7D13|nr:calcium/sodium antiporter [Yoonia maritima]